MHRHLTLLLLAAAAAPAFPQSTGIALTNGVDGYLEVPYSPAIVPLSGITLEAWITYDETTLPTGWRYPTIFRQNQSAGTEVYFLRINADNSNRRVLRWTVATSATAFANVDWAFNAGQLNTWTHVAATYDGSNAVLYVNGQPVGTRAATGSMLDRGDTLRIGKGSDIGGPIEVWNGQIDEARLWPFARTQAEIQATMNQMLVSVPGRVSTWNLDGFSIDTSGGQNATLNGAVTYTANTLALTIPTAPVGTPVGSSTPGCLGTLQMSVGSVATVGNLAFAPMCTRAPANAAGFLVMSFRSLTTQLTFAGVNVWVDLNGSVAVLANVDRLGAARYPVPVPATVIPGFQVALQYGFIDPCGPQGITASNALQVPIQ